MKICINAGHCLGLDSGAVGQTGLQESEVTKEVMQLTAEYLRNVGYEVLEVQENELYQITDASNLFGADLFISIHCNAAENRSASGTETFYGSNEGARLAQCIQSQIVDNLKTVDRGIKDGSHLYVIRNTDCVAVLTELAFISNEVDECMLSDIKQRTELARALARGITDYAR